MITLGRAIALVATVGACLIAGPVAPATASGGGGCGGPVTEGRGTKITIERFCFTPTVLYAEPGDRVRWTNLDAASHTVGGANLAWGSFEQLRAGRSTSYSFSRPGVYSYVCSLHPGMVGTVVVAGPGPGAASSAENLPLAAPGARSGAPVSAGAPLGAVALGLATGIAGFVAGARVRRARP